MPTPTLPSLLREAIAHARELDEQRRASGFDQVVLDEATRKGFPKATFEKLEEEIPAVVEEFFPSDETVGASQDLPRK